MTGRQHSKEDVIRAAGRLFAQRGFHGTSMRDLGGELGLLGSSLYSHVDGKTELLTEVIRSGAAMFQDLAAGVAGDGRSAAERLRLLIEGHIQILTDHLDEATTFLNEARFLPDEERSAIVSMRDRYEAVFRATIEDGKAGSEFRSDVDPVVASILILSMLNAIDRWYWPDGSRSPQDIAVRIYNLVMRGLT
jgi:AcrR family transcriptional regulator